MYYKAPVKDIEFLLNQTLNVDAHQNLAGFADADKDTRSAILEEMAKFCSEVLTPLNKVGDHQGCKLDADGNVTTPDGFKDAYNQYIEGGWSTIGALPEFGGQGLPYYLSVALSEMVSSANMSWAMYPGLSRGAYAAILVHANDELKQKYLPKMVDGTWTGTMNLTEPHCGTDLGLLRTKAVPNADGSYDITGQKIFISAGEHDMAENIIHLVLARIEGAPEGTKGISLFIVPKFMVNEDGSLGARNPVKCGKLEEKMGIHGNATCVMNYDGAKGYLVGEENKGLKAMFVMMNEARLGVALQGLAQSEIAYQNALTYAKDRIQGRALTGAVNKDGPADPIIVHPDVRRMLMDIKSFNEGARGLLYWVALLSDIAHLSDDKKQKEIAEDYMALMTPVMKGYFTDKGFDNAVMAQQVYGGHGFIEEWGMSQFVRDARIAMIYEGANGVQALDLVGRKIGANNGRAIQRFFGECDKLANEVGKRGELKKFKEGLKTAKNALFDASLWMMKNGLTNFNNAAGSSYDYMHLFGITALAFSWCKQGLALGNDNSEFAKTKIKTGTYFMERIVPMVDAHLGKIKAGSKTMMEMGLDEF